jgi:ABC-type Fe3+/spermidine/putrescine transport system ATPase subunit
VNAPSTPVIEVKGITKVFPPNVVAVRDVSFSVAHGELLAILGPSGCGKTTLLRMINGLEMPTDGSVSIHGREVTRLPPERRPTATIFQNYALFPNLSVYQNVEYGLKIRGIPRTERARRVEALLENFQISNIGDRPVTRISVGEMQRVAIARALAIEPAILLLDEPFSVADAVTKAQLIAELRELHERLHFTAILVTHAQAEAFSLADRIAVMNAGRIEQLGPPAEIYFSPRTPFVARFVGKNNTLPATVVEARGEDVLVETPIGLLTARVRDPEQARPGTSWLYVLRADTVSLRSLEEAASTEEAQCCVRGVVRGVELSGVIATYAVDVEDGHALIAEQYHPDLRPAAQAGDAVVLTWSAVDVLLLGGNDAASTSPLVGTGGTGPRAPRDQ